MDVAANTNGVQATIGHSGFDPDPRSKTHTFDENKAEILALKLTHTQLQSNICVRQIDLKLKLASLPLSNFVAVSMHIRRGHSSSIVTWRGNPVRQASFSDRLKTYGKGGSHGFNVTLKSRTRNRCVRNSFRLHIHYPTHGQPLREINGNRDFHFYF